MKTKEKVSQINKETSTQKKVLIVTRPDQTDTHLQWIRSLNKLLPGFSISFAAEHDFKILSKRILEEKIDLIIVYGELSKRVRGSRFYVKELVDSLRNITGPDQHLLVAGWNKSEEDYYLELPMAPLNFKAKYNELLAKAE